MKSLSRTEDIAASKKATEREENYFLKIPKEKTPWRLLNLEYEDGFVHWYPASQGNRRIVCLGGLEGKGFATDVCPICSHVLDLYNEAKELEADGESSSADKVKKRANDLHAKAEFQIKVIRGTRILVRVQEKGRMVKRREADFEGGDGDEEGMVEAGILSLSEAQFNGLTGLIKGEGTEFIQNGDDLATRTLWTHKENRKGRKGGQFSAVVWAADSQETEMPEFEIPKEVQELNLADNFEVDAKEVSRIAEGLSQEGVAEVDDSEDVEFEDAAESSTDEEFEPNDADLDDDSEDDLDLEGLSKSQYAYEDGAAISLDDIEGDDDSEDNFVDDLPEIQVDLPKKKKAPKRSSGTAVKTAPKRTRPPVNRKSGKTRL